MKITEEFIRKLPKTDFHVHSDGSLRIETILDLAEKQKIKIGQSFIDKNRCLPYASARPCIVCEEHCPTPTKAIWVEDIEVTNESGQKILVQQPHVDPELCVGCGICQNKCPIRDRSGIYVTSVGETRNPENQMLL